ncbi:MAG TPA: sugar ABC transporter substrate-binding protein [Solirubrobacteraceae bacterium]|nr:sugar ABC transporter substrate-binding protein [Solirubrobacteraceae bacterium]
MSKSVRAVALGLAGLSLLVAGCGDDSGGGGGGGGAAETAGSVGVDFPRADSDFWNSYNGYVPEKAKTLGVNLLPATNSENDIQKLVANVQSLTGRGAKAIVMAPQDTAAIASTLDRLEQDDIPAVSVDTRPDKGAVYMVVRADNRAYGEKACKFLGEKLQGKGNVVEFQGALSSINGRDRSEAFGECMKANYPDIEVFAIPTDWEGPRAAAGLKTTLTKTGNDINGIYMQAGGVFLAPTIQVLKQEKLLVPPDDPKHIFIVSNDGIPQELQGIKDGEIDATVSQPADAYAEWGLFYAKAAMEGKTFKAGPTDHDSTIVEIPNGLEDQLAAPLVTADGQKVADVETVPVDDPSLWGNQVK